MSRNFESLVDGWRKACREIPVLFGPEHRALYAPIKEAFEAGDKMAEALQRRDELLCAELGRVKAALKPLAALRVPHITQYNAGACSIRFDDIRAAQAAMNPIERSEP